MISVLQHPEWPFFIVYLPEAQCQKVTAHPVSQTNQEQEAKKPVSFQDPSRAQFSCLVSMVNSQAFWKFSSAFLFLPSLPVWFVGQLGIVELSRLPVVNLFEESTKLYM